MIQDGSARQSLAGLQDIVPPPEVSMGPTAPGWIALGLALLAALVVVAVWLALRHRALRYRRAALAELDALRAGDRLEDLPELLKRVALAAYPREEVAPLSGDAWTDFLDRTGGAGRFSAGAGETLGALAYGGGRSEEREPLERLLSAADAWIRAQRPAWEAHG